MRAWIIDFAKERLVGRIASAQGMGTSLYLREHHFPNVYATAAAA